MRNWLKRLGVKTLFIEPGSPWENGYIESFNGKLMDEVLTRESFHKLVEAKAIIESWRRENNQVRPHSSPGYPPRRRKRSSGATIMGVGNGTGGKLKDSLYFWYKHWEQVKPASRNWAGLKYNFPSPTSSSSRS